MSRNNRTALFMETTEVPAGRSAAAITEVLVNAGASRIQMEYRPGGSISGMSFEIFVKSRPQPYFYRMPVRTQVLYKILADRKGGWISDRDKQRLHEKAERIAWRQLFRWTQVQMAMVQLGMAETGEVFLPYLQGEGGQSMYQLFQAHESRMLEAPGSERQPGTVGRDGTAA